MLFCEFYGIIRVTRALYDIILEHDRGKGHVLVLIFDKGVDKMREILFLEPILKEMIWGGDKLQSVFGYDIPSPHTGECWAISAHEKGDCRIKNGQYKGMTLRTLWREHQELFGNQAMTQFPLLVKIIDAKQDLSIQVHPDDAYAKIHEHGAFGKTECWYILDCDENTDIVIGHHAKDKAELTTMIDEKCWDKLIRKIPIKKGDFFQINPGTVHAIKAGSLILEIQQNSNVTYRVYDYDRLENGKRRDLHLAQSLDVIEVPYVGSEVHRQKIAQQNYTIEKLISCAYYQVDKLDLNGEAEFSQDLPFCLCSVIEGAGNIDGIAIKKGDHFILPKDYGQYRIDGDVTIVRSGIA